jgi:defect-in-organelle-trafficking protein DotB
MSTEANQNMIREELDLKFGNQITENDVRELLYHGKKLNVSDITIDSGMPLMAKKNNIAFPIGKTIIQEEIQKRITGILFGAREGDDSTYSLIMNGKFNNTTYAFDVKQREPGVPKEKVRYRVNTIRRGENSVSIRARLNNNNLTTLKDINLNQESDIYKLMFPMKGLNFITGSVDSGKTTLIYACLGEFILHDKRPALIDTFENPIEGDLMGLARKADHQNKLVNQCPIPDGLTTFTVGVEEALRRNTDIIVFGEIRERKEVDAVMMGVLRTGKLLMGTLHTDNIPSTIQALVNALDSDDKGKTKSLTHDLISALNIIVSQKLLTTISGGRVAVYELLHFTKEIKNNLKKIPVDEIPQAIADIMIESGNTMVDKAEKLLEDEVISEEVFRHFKDSFSY